MLVIGVHAFDELVLVISLPSIAPQLGLQETYGLTIAAYILAAITGMSWSGRLIDSLGPQRVLAFALIVFSSGIVLSIIAWNSHSFIFARTLQGFGGGIGNTCAFALINLLNTGRNRGHAVMAIDLSWVVPSVAAPLIGGLLVDHLSWRAIFILQIPIIATIAWLLLPNLGHLNRQQPLPSLRNFIDALRVAFGTGLFLYLVAQPLSWLWLAIILAGFIMLPAFNRVMPQLWWKGGTPLALPILVGLLSFTAFYGMEAYQPLFLIDYAGLSTSHAGFIVTFASVSWLFGSHCSARIYPRLSRLQLMTLGNSLLLAGITCLGFISLSEWAIGWMYPSWALAGLGMGFTFNASRTSAMENTPPNQEGFVATALTLASNMGIGLSSGIGGAIKNQVFAGAGDMRQVLLWVVALGFCVVLFNLSMMVRRARGFSQKPARQP